MELYRYQRGDRRVTLSVETDFWHHPTFTIFDTNDPGYKYETSDLFIAVDDYREKLRVIHNERP